MIGEIWFYVAGFVLAGAICGFLAKKLSLKDKKTGIWPMVLLGVMYGLVALRFFGFPGPDMYGRALPDSFKVIQAVIYSLMSYGIVVLGWRIKGFDYAEAARKKHGITDDDIRLEKPIAEQKKENRTIEIAFLIGLFILGVCAAMLLNGIDMPWWYRAIGIIAASVPFLIMGHKTESWKDGEVLLMASAGAILGWRDILIAVFLGIAFNSLVMCYRLLTRPREQKGKKLTPMRMAPFLAMGIFLAALYGHNMLWWFYGLYM